jgi:hypothetical protein
VSFQIHGGVPVRQVAAQLGHSKNSMTVDTYSHVIVEEHGTCDHDVRGAPAAFEMEAVAG